ncbi:hypothetical protein ILYODFUR_030989 [Ilyodon furcidens]|uniref:EGF-like domain-containing protein n=1 Tax=Ilyodon furcidens TaxID=33524 RepID=A0ABV0TDS8_9TELE
MVVRTRRAPHWVPFNACDPCAENVCNNGGTCVTGTGTPFICICPDGFSGETCNETETGPCSPNPCKNDGVCESRRGDVFTDYVCRCQPGFEGIYCQTSVQGADLTSLTGNGGNEA